MRKLLSALGAGLVCASASGLAGVVPAHAAAVTVNCTTVAAALTVDGNDITLDNGGVPCTNATTTGGLPITITTGITVSLHGKSQADGFDGENAHSILKGLNNGASVISNLTFKNGNNASGAGGAISLSGSPFSPTVSNSIFLGNQTTSAGGAVDLEGNGTAIVANNTFGSATAPNTSVFGGGGLYLTTTGAATVTSNQFVDNIATGNCSCGGGAGALVSSGSTASPAITFTNNTLTGNNSAGAGGGAFLNSSGGQIVLTGNTFSKNILSSVGTENGANRGAGVSLFVTSQAVPGTVVQSHNVFDSNKIQVVAAPGVVSNATTPAGQPKAVAPIDYGGAGEFAVATTVTSTDDAYTSNTVASSGNANTPIGGGFALQGTTSVAATPVTQKSTLTAYNMVVTNNTVGANGEGGGVYAGFSSGCQNPPCTAEIDLFDSTVSNNTIGAGGTGPEMAGDVTDVAAMVNDIVTGPAGATDVQGFGTITANHTDTCNAGAALTGTGNLCVDPTLVNVATNDVHEKSTSPTVDRGDKTQVPASLTNDFYGIARVQGANVDMGAAEVAVAAPVLPAAGSGPGAPTAPNVAWLLLVAAAAAAGVGLLVRRPAP